MTFLVRDVGSISNLGCTMLQEHFFLTTRAFSKNKKGISLFTTKSWGHMPPVPTAPVYAFGVCRTFHNLGYTILSVSYLSALGCAGVKLPNSI